MSKIIVPREELQLVMALDGEIRRRAETKTEIEEDRRLTFTWGLLHELRRFCGLLALGLGKQIEDVEILAKKNKILTPAGLTIALYRAVRAFEKGEPIDGPAWMVKLFEKETVNGENED
jgi:hypothetical protein